MDCKHPGRCRASALAKALDITVEAARAMKTGVDPKAVKPKQSTEEVRHGLSNTQS